METFQMFFFFFFKLFLNLGGQKNHYVDILYLSINCACLVLLVFNLYS